MPLPEDLEDKEKHFARTGRIGLSTDESFRDSSWFAVLIGQGHRPCDYNPLTDSVDAGASLAYLQRIKAEIHSTAAKRPTHESCLA
jgi:tryptophan halogenase